MVLSLYSGVTTQTLATDNHGQIYNYALPPSQSCGGVKTLENVDQIDFNNIKCSEIQAFPFTTLYHLG